MDSPYEVTSIGPRQCGPAGPDQWPVGGRNRAQQAVTGPEAITGAGSGYSGESPADQNSQCASIGIAYADGDTAAGLLSRADAAMYQDKHARKQAARPRSAAGGPAAS
ncbi:MAG: hypothetical protein ABI140_02665 [Jatrophihabitantaceae bacterium]